MKHSRRGTAALLAGIAILPATAQAQLEWQAEIGIGYNSNIYQTPNENYIDISATGGGAAIVPDIKSGFFIPVDLGLDYEKMVGDAVALQAKYRLDAYRYIDRAYSNGDKTSQKVSVGGQYIFGRKKSRRDALYAYVFAKKVKEFYVDRDSGDDKLAAGTTDVSKRYWYDSVGAQLGYQYKTGEIQYGIEYTIETLDYADPIVVSQYDHDFWELAGEIEFRLAKPTKLYLDASLSNRAYDERPSRDLQGRALASYPPREYDYSSFEATVRHRINDAWVTYVGYRYSTRDDLYVGYNSYTGHTLKARFLRKTERARTRIAFSYKTLDYDNAFAFETPAGGAKTYDAFTASVSTELPRGEHQAWVAGIDYTNVDTNDTRYKYDRYRISAGYKWEY